MTDSLLASARNPVSRGRAFSREMGSLLYPFHFEGRYPKRVSGAMTSSSGVWDATLQVLSFEAQRRERSLSFRERDPTGILWKTHWKRSAGVKKQDIV